MPSGTGNPTAAAFDVVIVGARCAGAPLGTLLAREGVKVALVEQAQFPRDTLSSHIFETDALTHLEELGVATRLLATGAPFVNHTDMRVEDVRLQLEWPRGPGDPGGLMSVRRFVLDPILAAAAAEAGAELRMGARVVGLIEEGGRVAGVRVDGGSAPHELRADLVVGADGRQSTVARLVGARKYNVTHNQRTLYWRYYENAQFDEQPTFVTHRWSDRFVLGIPADGGLYQAVIWPEFADFERHGGDLESLFAEQLSGCEPIERCIAGGRPVGKILGARRWEMFFREAAGPGWVLVGDAGHFKDPGPGRGIGDALLQAHSLAHAIAAALHPRSQLDQAMRRWARWRDEEFAEHYWFAADTSATGHLPAVLSELLRDLKAKGRAGEFFELLNHRARPSSVLTPARVLRATAAALARRSGHRREVLRDVGGLLVEDRRRRRLNRRPVYAPAAGAGPSR